MKPRKKKKKPTKTSLAKQTGTHIDTMFRVMSGRARPSAKLAKQLEKILGIDRRRFLWPEDFGTVKEAFDEKYE